MIREYFEYILVPLSGRKLNVFEKSNFFVKSAKICIRLEKA